MVQDNLNRIEKNKAIDISDLIASRQQISNHEKYPFLRELSSGSNNGGSQPHVQGPSMATHVVLPTYHNIPAQLT
jgi:hypothetical protein